MIHLIIPHNSNTYYTRISNYMHVHMRTLSTASALLAQRSNGFLLRARSVYLALYACSRTCMYECCCTSVSMLSSSFPPSLSSSLPPRSLSPNRTPISMSSNINARYVDVSEGFINSCYLIIKYNSLTLNQNQWQHFRRNSSGQMFETQPPSLQVRTRFTGTKVSALLVPKNLQ